MKSIYTIALAIISAIIDPLSSTTAVILLGGLLLTTIKSQSIRPLTWIMLGWLVWIPLNLAFSVSPGLSLNQIAILLCLPLGWAVGIGIYGINRVMRQSQLYFFLAALLSILILWGLVQGPNTFTFKPQGPFNDPNSYAAAINVLTIPLVAVYLYTNPYDVPKWGRVFMLALLGCSLFTLFLIASRGASLALIISVAPLLWAAKTRKRYIKKLTILLALALIVYHLAVFVSSGGSTVAQRLMDTIQRGESSRFMLWQSAWSMIQDHPWLGSGLGSFRLLYPKYRFDTELSTAGGWVHNDYLQLWLEAGLPMFVLVLALLVWIAIRLWCLLRDSDNDALLKLGYLCAILSALLHAVVNFVLFFSFIMLLVGLYLSVLHAPCNQGSTENALAINRIRSRQYILGVRAYCAVVILLLVGQVAVEVFVWKSRELQYNLSKIHIPYPTYQAAYWTSILSPFHPSPHQAMGLALADAYLLTRVDKQHRDEALARLDNAWRLAPCYLPYANDALEVIRQSGDEEELHTLGRTIALRSIDCNARHGLSYYYAGRFSISKEDALMWWQAGIKASLLLPDRILLASAILSLMSPEHSKEYDLIANELAGEIRMLEGNPNVRASKESWDEIQHRLNGMGGALYRGLVPPPVISE